MSSRSSVDTKFSAKKNYSRNSVQGRIVLLYNNNKVTSLLSKKNRGEAIGLLDNVQKLAVFPPHASLVTKYLHIKLSSFGNSYIYFFFNSLAQL